MKRFLRFYFFVSVLAFSGDYCLGQNVAFSEKHLNPPVLVNFKALSDSQVLHPPVRAKRFIEQGEDRFENFKVAPRPIKAGSAVYQIPPTNNLKSLVNSSPPLLSFDAVQDYGVLIPPDIQGAVGTNYVLETTNQEFDVYNKAGGLVNAVSLINFFSIPGSWNYFDPHVVYDAAHGRYIVCCDGSYLNGDGGLFVGVSLTSDPTGNWYIYSFDAAGNDTVFIDYPEIGFNNKWVVLTANNYVNSNNVDGMIYVLRSDSLYQGNLGSVKIFMDTASFSIVPAQTIDSTQSVIYLVHDANGNQGGNGYMQIGSVTGAVDSPVYNFGYDIGVNQPWNENPVRAVQDGGDNTIEDGDTRVMNGVTFINGSLWFAHNVFLPADTPTHTAVDWWQVDPVAATVQQFGRIEDSDNQTFYFYPSIAVNAKNDMVLGYCISSTSYYPSSAYSFRFSADPVNTLRNTYTYRFGMGSYDKTFGSNRNRWGDFTGTAVDPVDSSFWNFNQYSGITNNWATSIAHIADGTTPCKTRAAFIYSTGLSCGAPFEVKFTNLSASASNYYWDFGDGTSSPLLNPAHTYEGPGVYSVKLIASDAVCGMDSVLMSDVIHISNDDPATQGADVCNGQTAAISARGQGVIYWFDSLAALIPLDTGNVFITPPVHDTTVYYAELHLPGPVTSCGPINNNFGPGAYFTTDSKHHLVVFDCKYPQILQSVDVYSGYTGSCSVQLQDPNNVAIESATFSVVPGLNTLNLNFELPVVHDLKLTTQNFINLYYDSSGAAYPYYSTDSTIVLLHSDIETTSEYYYFYNWKMQTACLSNRIPVQVNVINPQTSFDFGNLSAYKVHFIPANANATSCHWLFGDGATSDQFGISHTYSAPGIYPVQLIEQVEGCTDTVVQVVAVDTGSTSALSEVQSMFIYPDPVQNQLTVQVGIKLGGEWTLLVRDLLGGTVISKGVQLNAGLNNLLLDVSELPAGSFIISLRSGKTVVKRRFVKDN